MKTLHLNKGRESSLLRRHPWVFSGAIARLSGEPAAGETIKVVDAVGNPIALAAYSPHSQIRARVWSFDPNARIDADFMRARLSRAIARRASLLANPERTACRLVYAESDELPGLVVDRYDGFLVCQFNAVGVEGWRHEIVEALRDLFPCEGIYERSDSSARQREGLAASQGVLWGKEPPELVEIRENGRLLGVNIAHGHKTGFYLDQVDNRDVVRALSRGRRVLNCFSYTGGFGIAALKGGADFVCNVDSSAPSLALAAANFARNGFSTAQYATLTANVFDVLRDFRQRGEHYDLIVLDPPKFAETKVQFKKAARAYKDIALQASLLLPPGGLLVSFSCSGAIDLPLFHKITADAVLDAGRQGQILQFLHQSQDHPVGLPFPESLYLKGLVTLLE